MFVLRHEILMKLSNTMLHNHVVLTMKFHFKSFNASAPSGYPRFPAALNSTSKRVRVNARINSHPASNVTIDTAADVSCISVEFMPTFPNLKDTEMNLSSADGSLLKS